MMAPTIGRIVIFKLTASQAKDADRMQHTGAIGHSWKVGNPIEAGEEYPMLICRVFPNEFGAGVPGVNGQVFLDGNYTIWVTSAKEGDAPGEWHWPTIVK